MDALPPPPALTRPPRGSRWKRTADILLGKIVTILLAALAVALAVATFATLAGGVPSRPGRTPSSP